MKKIIAILLVLSCFLMCFSVSAQGTYDDVITSGYIESEKVGNIFFVTDENIRFTHNYKNTAGQTAKIQSVYRVLNEAGAVLNEYPVKTVEIPAGENATLEYAVENPGKYGLYTLEVENHITVDGVRFSKTYDEDFSVCITLDEKNVDPNFGFSQQIISKGYGDADVTSTLMRNAGAEWYREDCLTWSMVESDKTSDELTIPVGAKEKLRKIKDKGLKIVCILNGANGKSYANLDAQIDAFARYCNFVATELDGIVDHFEIWNEWNNREGDKTATTYAKVITKAYDAVKDANENNTVIGCVTAGIDYEWIDSVLTNLGNKKAMDAVSVHCYPWTKANGVDEEQLITYTTSLKDVLQEHSLDIPVFLTEIGFSTFDGEVKWIEPCTEYEQLNSLVFANTINKAYGLFDKLLQYSFHDRANKAGVESNWGLVNCWQRGYTENPEAELTPYGAKPAYLGIAAMNYFIGGNTEYQEMIKDESDRAYMIKFKNNNLNKNVMLCINGDLNETTPKSIDLETNRVKIYDKYGNFVEERISLTGNFAFEISAEPMYVTWSERNEGFLNVEVNENTNTVTIMGYAEAPDDLVSVMVVSKGEEIDVYDPSRVLFVGQATANDYSEYSVSFVMPELTGQFDVYANSKLRKEKQMEDLVLSYSIPEIKVMQDGADVFKMDELNVSAPVNIELRGFRDLTDEKAVLIIAQYSGDRLLSTELDLEAVGDSTKPGAEIKKSFKVKNGADSVKVMYMNISNAKPFVAAYEIK